MGDAPPAVAARQDPLIRRLNSNDVLMGRGIGPSTFEGNIRFRDEIVAPRKAEYAAEASYKIKGRIGKEVYLEVKARGGRFLSVVETNDGNGNPRRNIVENGTWREITEQKALEKCKQSLRQQEKEEKVDESGIVLGSSTGGPRTLPLTCPEPARQLVDSRCLPFQPSLNTGPVVHSQLNEFNQRPLVSPVSSTSSNARSRQPDSETEDAAFALSSLAVSDRPKFTAEDERRERAQMTSEERVIALADLFGQSCSLDFHHRKRARRDLDAESISFLIRHMRYELEQIPVHKKQALMEAQKNGCLEEFSDGRLEQFLRVEGMSPKLAAERLCRYWEERKKLFGDKYLSKMTLGESLSCADLVALKSGVYRLLPALDSAGRQIIVMDPHLNTKEGYTAENMLRCIWYIVEVAAQENTHIDRGCVVLAWDAHSSVLDFDPSLFGPLAHYEKSCWPIKFVARHVCCTSSMMLRIMNPVLMALMDKESRSRLVLHNVPESEIVTSLSSYGIPKDVLPLEMGGSTRIDMNAWIARRRSLEMEEI